MSRPDLQPGYEGWQALDPTPQEKSEGGYAWPPSLGGKAKPWRELPDSASAGGSQPQSRWLQRPLTGLHKCGGPLRQCAIPFFII